MKVLPNLFVLIARNLAAPFKPGFGVLAKGHDEEGEKHARPTGVTMARGLCGVEFLNLTMC